MSTREDFMEGRRLAVEMLSLGRAMQEEQPFDRASIEARYRGGDPQQNFVLTYLQKLFERPELAEGFGAVLSDKLGTCGAFPWVYARLRYRQIVGVKRAKEPRA